MEYIIIDNYIISIQYTLYDIFLFDAQPQSNKRNILIVRCFYFQFVNSWTSTTRVKTGRPRCFLIYQTTNYRLLCWKKKSYILGRRWPCGHQLSIRLNSVILRNCPIIHPSTCRFFCFGGGMMSELQLLHLVKLESHRPWIR